MPASDCGTCGVPGQWQCVDCPRRAIIHTAPIPSCPAHGGPMKYDAPRDWWVCAGWDGEGCDHTQPAEWQLSGTTGAVVLDPAGHGQPGHVCGWGCPQSDPLADIQAVWQAASDPDVERLWRLLNGHDA